MRLDLSVSMSAGAPVVSIGGEVDLLVSDDLYEFLATVISQRGPRLSVDLRRVTFMDSSGASALLSARRLARALGGNLTLIGPSAPAALVLRTVLPDQPLGDQPLGSGDQDLRPGDQDLRPVDRDLRPSDQALGAEPSGATGPG